MGKFGIVAIGSSAGGIRALEILLSGLPPDLPIPLLIVQHLDPRHRSLMAEILQRRSKLEVKEAADGEIIKPSTVYIAPPNKHMLVSDGNVSLTSTAFVHFSRPSIDLLFESVAATYGEETIGIILSGTGRDGAMGIKAIKEKGGTTIAQDKETSEHFGMPDAAIATGMVDFVIPVQDISKAIIELTISREEL
ncbi:MAG TPA: chemotaxis protein CheB [Methanocella sp.]|nr:chemotaxis protein CheB [Methanocella sp.]